MFLTKEQNEHFLWPQHWELQLVMVRFKCGTVSLRIQRIHLKEWPDRKGVWNWCICRRDYVISINIAAFLSRSLLLLPLKLCDRNFVTHRRKKKLVSFSLFSDASLDRTSRRTNTHVECRPLDLINWSSNCVRLFDDSYDICMVSSAIWSMITRLNHTRRLPTIKHETTSFPLIFNQHIRNDDAFDYEPMVDRQVWVSIQSKRVKFIFHVHFKTISKCCHNSAREH